MELHEALVRRCSRRKFKEEAMSEKALGAFLAGLDSIPLLHPEAALTIRFLTYGELKTLFPNYYKSLIYAPYYLFFYGEKSPALMQNIGYLGELSSLWLTCNGYGSCWQVVKGLEQTVWPEAERLLRAKAEQEESERILTKMRHEAEDARELRREDLVTEAQRKVEGKDLFSGVQTTTEKGNETTEKKGESEGLPAESGEPGVAASDAAGSAGTVDIPISAESLSELSPAARAGTEETEGILAEEESILFPAKALEQVLAFGVPDLRMGTGRAASRKRLHALLISGSPEPNPAFRRLLESARTAPSEYNSQPWRFWASEHCIHVFIKPARLFGSKLRHLNEHVSVGCMLANLITQAELSGMELEMRIEREPFAPIRELEYVMSLYLKNPLDVF